MPKVSVLMPAYNAEKYIAEAIDSILKQTYTDFELIVIDDASTDSTVEIIKSYTDPRIRFYQNECNLGVANTLNRGLDYANGIYIARMDSDDISFPNRIEKQVRYMDENSNVGVCGGNAMVFSEENQYNTELPLTDKDIKFTLFISSPFVHPAILMRKSVIDDNKLHYSMEFEGREDYHLWMQFSLTGCKFHNLNETIIKYRIHESQVTKKNDHNQFDKHLKLKKWYLNSLGFSCTNAELEALCLCSIGKHVSCNSDIENLKKLLVRICVYFDEKYLSKLYQHILFEEAFLLNGKKLSTLSIINDQSFEIKLRWIWCLIRRKNENRNNYLS